MSEIPKLIVLCGYPSSGKSSIAQFLVRTYGFVGLSTDSMREMMYSVTDYPSFQQQPDSEEKDMFMMDCLQHLKLMSLSQGKQVAFDSSAMTHHVRDWLLKTDFDGWPIQTKKYLLEVKTQRDILDQRNAERGRSSDCLSLWDKHWQDAVSGPDYTLLSYENNTSEDMTHIKSDLESRLSL